MVFTSGFVTLTESRFFVNHSKADLERLLVGAEDVESVEVTIEGFDTGDAEAGDAKGRRSQATRIRYRGEFDIRESAKYQNLEKKVILFFIKITPKARILSHFSTIFANISANEIRRRLKFWLLFWIRNKMHQFFFEI